MSFQKYIEAPNLLGNLVERGRRVDGWYIILVIVNCDRPNPTWACAARSAAVRFGRGAIAARLAARGFGAAEVVAGILVPRHARTHARTHALE